MQGLGCDDVFSDVTFDVGKGEIVGLFGLVGSGRTDVARAIFGAEPATRGRMTLDGHPYAPRSPGQALRAGVAYLTEDRGRDGLIPHQTIRPNISLAIIQGQARLGFVVIGNEKPSDGWPTRCTCSASEPMIPRRSLIT